MKQLHFKIISIISLAIILAFTFTACGEDSDELVGFVWIPAGIFYMGSPTTETGRDSDETQHWVTLTKGFYMSKYQITQGQYFAIMEYNPSNYTVSTDGKGRLPVEGISWYDAIEFCNKLSEKYGLTPAYTIDKTYNSDPNNNSTYDTLKWLVTVIPNANGYRLPTEAEWEYACRAGTTTAWFHGDIDTGLEDYAWYSVNSGDNGGSTNRKTHEVGKKLPNAWGLYDMHGNVEEWCWDWFGAYPSDCEDYIGPSGGSSRMLRGGSCYASGQNLRSAYRYYVYPSYSNGSIGFRLVRP